MFTENKKGLIEMDKDIAVVVWNNIKEMTGAYFEAGDIDTGNRLKVHVDNIIDTATMLGFPTVEDALRSDNNSKVVIMVTSIEFHLGQWSIARKLARGETVHADIDGL